MAELKSNLMRSSVCWSSDLAGWGLLVLFLSSWNAVSNGTIAWEPLLFFASFVLVCLVAGHLVHTGLESLLPIRGDVASRFLMGFFFLNILIYVAGICFPFRIVVCVLVLAILVIAGGIVLLIRYPGNSNNSKVETRNDCGRYALASLLVSLVAATLWCRGILIPAVSVGNSTIFKPWSDSFIHAALITSMRTASSLASLQDIRFAGEHAPFYHIASYIFPSALTSLTLTPSYTAILSFWTPLGIVLTGLAAFVLINSLWGARPAFIASSALLLLPDPSQFLGTSSYLSYHWLQIIAPGGMYATALMAVVWLFVLHGCTTGRFLPILTGWLLAAACLVFKAHLAVANAALLWFYPPLFMKNLSRKFRIGWAAAAGLLLFLTGTIVRKVPTFPVINLDFSAMASYINDLLTLDHEGLVTSLFHGVREQAPFIQNLLLGGLYLFIATFGVGGIVCLLQARRLRSSSLPHLALFPLLVISNYLLMSLGLSYDTRSIATPDELLHRPFVWAYFVVIVWTAGALAEQCLDSATPVSRKGAIALTAMVFLLIMVPAYFGGDIQDRKWAIEHTRLPVSTDLVKISEYLRMNSRSTDIVQDFQHDPHMIVTALSERRPYVIKFSLGAFGGERIRQLLVKRESALLQLYKQSDGVTLVELARQLGINWIILHPHSNVAWPEQVVAKPVVAQGDYRLYHLY